MSTKSTSTHVDNGILWVYIVEYVVGAYVLWTTSYVLWGGLVGALHGIVVVCMHCGCAHVVGNTHPQHTRPTQCIDRVYMLWAHIVGEK